MKNQATAIPPRRRVRLSFYLLFGLLGVFAALVGFGYTYLAPIATGRLEVPLGVHFHGIISAVWILLYALQSILIRRRKFIYHRQLGYFGVFILVGFTLSLFTVGDFVVQRGLQQGDGDFAYNQLIGVLTSGRWVLILGLLDVYYRRRPRLHKICMFLATAVILWPAYSLEARAYKLSPNGSTTYLPNV